MSMMSEFKQFAVQGNVMDLAVGVIIGAAFGKITNSLVADILMPPIGMLLGRVDFTNLFIALDGKSYATLKAAKDAAAPTMNVGIFANTVIEFLVVAFSIFLVVKWMNSLRSEKKA